VFNQLKIEDIIKNYSLLWGGVTVEYQPQEIIQYQNGLGESYLKPESKITSLQIPISNINGALKTRNIIINEKGAIGILSSSSKDTEGGIPLGEKEKEQILTSYQKKYGIGDEQSKIIVTNSSLNWQPMSYPTKDLMLFEEVEDDFAAILATYGMDRDIFPSTKGATNENKKQGLLSTYQNTIQPEADTLMRLLSKRLGLTQQGLSLVANYEWLPVMQKNKTEEANAQKVKSEGLSIMLRDGVINAEQYAEMAGVEYFENLKSQEDKIINAQTELKSTVGGVTGIIALNQSVSRGEIDRNSAISILINVYGFESSQANSMITNEKVI
jgi:hypothetical protein